MSRNRFSDGASAVPLYEQLKEMLLAQLRSNDLSVGHKLPPERELMQQYGVSRSTVRRALDELEQQGYVTRMQGVGTVVSKPKIRPEMMTLTSFTEDMKARGLKPGSVTLTLDLVEPSPAVRAGLRFETDSRVWYIKRLRLADDMPVGIHELYIPSTLGFAPHDLSAMQSYYDLVLERHRLKPVYATEHFTAKNADQEEARLLEIPAGSALLQIARVTYADNGAPFEYVNLVYRADRYEYAVTLYRK
ncbi:MAG: GntR family transcriptional regulator [Chloroflexi bacterium]|nr:GntR family transcriptional regulator [Chloroflexota bacterium]